MPVSGRSMTDGGSKLGFGVSGPLGAPWFSAARAASLVEAAVAGGVRWFDTAPFYGEAERRLGRALAGRDGALVASKTGSRLDGRQIVKDFSEASMTRDLEETLRRLDRPRLDALFLHGPSEAEMKNALPILRGFQRQGLVASIGVCAQDRTAMDTVALGFDALMATYNVFDRRHVAAFEAAHARGMRTFGIAPLGQALYARDFWRLGAPADLWRISRGLTARRADRSRYRAARAPLEAIDGWTPVEAALAFALAAPFLDVVLTTTTKQRHLAQAQATSGRRLDPAALSALQAISLDPPPAGA
jgi:aryl-alcohol dehydrogenase-like predicted oxidoreductase